MKHTFKTFLIFVLVIAACGPRSTTLTQAPTASISEPTVTTVGTTTLSTPLSTITPGPFSNNSERIAFAAKEAGGTFQIYTVKADGSELTRLTEGPLDHLAPLWSPDGTKILFQTASPESQVYEEIWVMDVDGKNQVNLTRNPPHDCCPSWSPDSQRIAFRSDRDGNEEVYLMNLDGSSLRLTDSLTYDFSPAWAPNGRQIAFASDRSGNEEIYTINIDGSDLTRLTNNDINDFHPFWSPDGSRITITSENKDFTNEIWVMQADGAELHKVSGDLFAYFPFWSPDGKQLVFTGYGGSEEKFSQIYLTDMEGTSLVKLTDESQDYVSGPWSPDGKRILFEAGPYEAAYHLYIMDLASQNITRLTKEEFDRERDAAWQPNAH